MTVAFDPSARLVFVTVDIDGPARITTAQFVLDTGSTRTLVNRPLLESLGYDLNESARRFQITTVSGIEYAPCVELTRLAALDTERLGLPVICHSLPETASFDGLLGLDFLRNHKLTVDFNHGTIELT